MDRDISKALAIAELMRPKNCAMAAFGALLGYWLSVGYVALPASALLVASSTFLICGAGQAINDYYDAAVDRKAKSKRPIPSGRLSAPEARSVALALFFLGIAVAFNANQAAFGVAVAFSVLLYVYSSRLSGLKYFGNAVVALSAAFTFVMGASISGNYAVVAVLATASFFSTWAREIAKDLEDYASDRGRKHTLPMLIGKRNAANTAVLSTAVSVAAGVLPLAAGLTSSLLFAAIFALSVAVFFLAARQLVSGEFSRSQKSYKLGMVVALAAFASLLA
jgi:geranylgeranylglycerol-phosphate geranylgeranyltransferase